MTINKQSPKQKQLTSFKGIAFNYYVPQERINLPLPIPFMVTTDIAYVPVTCMNFSPSFFILGIL